MEIQLAVASSPITVTYVLKDLSDSFYEGSDSLSLKGLSNLPDIEKIIFLQRKAADMPYNVKEKVGNGQFNTRVDLNRLLRKEDVPVTYNLTTRKGYKLATFVVG